MTTRLDESGMYQGDDELVAKSEFGTKRKCRNARGIPKLGVDRPCHPPASHSGP
jgi:hypothetical protein